MKKKYFPWVFLTLILLFSPSRAAERADLGSSFLQGINYYNQGDYSKAVSAFSTIAVSGVKNGKLYYNLGNSFLKNGDLGRAVLWFERSLKMIPNDPDLNFNLDYALSMLKDEIEEKINPIFRVLFFWKEMYSPKTFQWTAISLNLIFWVVMILRFLMKKRLLKTPGYVILFFVMIFSFTAFYSFYSERYKREAVILPEKISIRSGLTEGSTELFILHSGTKVIVQKEMQGFYRIYFSKGKIGWIKKEDAEVI